MGTNLMSNVRFIKAETYCCSAQEDGFQDRKTKENDENGVLSRI